MDIEQMEYEQAVVSAMDDTDPSFIKEAMKIIESNLSIREQTVAIYALFRAWKR